ncbi:unnamed protein product [Durusdinium trenchii]|uniref:Uncharacterized protein n=1 Tax=Durusdinium trenchii TaxID=1381693 RepID=A0ABP0KA80_9DINO
MVLRCFLLLISGVCGFSTSSELRAALLQWNNADQATKMQLRLLWGAPGEWNVSSVNNMSGLFKDLDGFNENISAWDTSKVVDMSSMFHRATSFNMPIGSWDTSRVQTMHKMFYKAVKFDEPIGSWKTGAVKNMQQMFLGARAFDQSIDAWDTTNVRDMKAMFYKAAKFNQPIGSWNVSAVTDMSYMFYGATSFNQSIGAWDTTSVTNMQNMFSNAVSLNQPIGSWKTQAVRNMQQMFWGAAAFDQPIGDWDTANVRDMNSMFYNAVKFNQPIGSWNTSAVVKMSFMFYGAQSFDQPINAWNTANVREMKAMFHNAVKFNQPIGSWNVSAVTDMSFMFLGARSFDQSIDAWDTSHVLTMKNMFNYAFAFNKPIGSWKTGAVKNMRQMFFGAIVFDQPINAWDTANVRDMADLFYGAVQFNQPIGAWNTSAVENMSFMFWGARSFNQPIGAWDTGNVRNMNSMFYNAAQFNQPIGMWNTRAVTNMSYMFRGATSFDQPIGAWDTSKVRDMNSMFLVALQFNQPIDAWNTANVRDMAGMFADASAFNQPIGAWDTSHVKDMGGMFEGASSFDQPLNHWDTSAVTNFSGMFFRASSFDQPVGMWDTSAAKDMKNMFAGARSFNQPVSTWNFTSIPDTFAMVNAFTGSGMSGCVLRLSSSALGLPYSMWQTWSYQQCPSCPCPQTNLACVDEACWPVNSGFIELGAGTWDDRNTMLVTAVGFRACVGSCEALGCTAFLLEGFERCLLMHDEGKLNLVAGGSRQSYLAFRKASCDTFSCPKGAPKVAEGQNRSAVTAASCCSCFAPNEIRDRSKEPDLECVTCPAGRAPQDDRCEECTTGYAKAGASQCATCPAGEVPVPGRTDCVACAPDEFTHGETCRSCSWPFLLLSNDCIWWHLPLIIVLFLSCSGLVFLVHRIVKKRHLRRETIRQEEVNQILQELDEELWHEKLDTLNRFFVALSSFGWTWSHVSQRAEEIRARHSGLAGVSLVYLMGEFAELAYDWSGEDDPTFLRLKEVFWQGQDKIGSNLRCPRDGRPGCALVDWLSPEHRQMQTHFMSWSWKYSLRQLQSAMKMWRGTRTLEFQDVFFYMCFFVNNQFRIIVEGSAAGSDNLEEVFETNLRRIGQVVAVLDTWREPIYLQRVWTIYEQYVACSLEVPVTFVMPEHASVSLSQQILDSIDSAQLSTSLRRSFSCLQPVNPL